MHKLIQPFLFVCIGLLLSSPMHAEQTAKKKKKPEPLKEAPKKSKYQEATGKMKNKGKGLFNYYLGDDKLLFEIPKSELGKEMLVVSTIAETPGIGYGGTNVGYFVVRWEYKYGKILLRTVSYNNVASDSLPIYQAVKLSNLEPVVKAFDVIDLSPDSSAYLIDATDLYLGDTYPFTFPAMMRTDLQISTLDKKRSFMESVKTFPINVESRALLTFNSKKPAQQGNTQTVTMVMNFSMIKLPENPMQPRYNDNRVGYFSVNQSTFSETQQVDDKSYITRWRLEPKDEDIEKFKKGILVEPKKQIVYYIDPATPEKWRAALIAGVEDWNVAFEEAGFKNAIACKMPPTAKEDPTWSPEDARYSVIRYFASDIKNAYGPHVHDPRTGEILESDIGWFHNVMNLLRNWYFVQASPNDVRAQKLPLPDSVMAELVRFVSSHEVGHTLGLQHNMKASHHFPTDSLRSKTFTAKYGTAPSIMDYARFNYVAQPGDGAALMPKISFYDKYAIKWGYMPILAAKSTDAEKPILDKWLEAQERDSTLRFGKQQGPILDPYSQTEDLGDDAIKSSTYGIKNLERVMGFLISATKDEYDNYDLLKEMYEEVLGQYRREVLHVANYVGGVERIEKRSNDVGGEYTPLPADIQKKSIKFVDEFGFTIPKAFLNTEVLSRIEGEGSVKRISDIQFSFLATMLDTRKLERLNENSVIGGPKNFDAATAMEDVYRTVFKEFYGGASPDVFRKNLELNFVRLMESKMVLTSSVKGLTIYYLNDIISKSSARTNVGEAASKAHYQQLKAEAQRILDYKSPAKTN